MSSETKKQGFFSRVFGSSKDTKKTPSKTGPPLTPESTSAPVYPNEPHSHQRKSSAEVRAPRRTKQRRNVSRKKGRTASRNISIQLEKIDVSKPIDFPATPEIILAYHKKKPFLSKNEEWLVVELNEYECLVESLEIIKVIANHSKFFEVEPDELWQEFFEFVEEIPSYDEIINYDVWQEFRDEKYPC